jgi:insertion element IS1 protein InsB
MTDYWQPYKNFIPKTKHVRSKAETYTIEGYNSLVRHFLARMKRKTKSYSKIKTSLEISLNLLFFKLNNGMQSILI